jgi:hypothetical protein
LALLFGLLNGFKFTSDEWLAGVTIAEGSVAGKFAAADLHRVNFGVQTKLDGLDLGPDVARVAERLTLAHATRAPEIVLRSKDRILNSVGANTRTHREGMLTQVGL